MFDGHDHRTMWETRGRMDSLFRVKRDNIPQSRVENGKIPPGVNMTAEDTNAPSGSAEKVASNTEAQNKAPQSNQDEKYSLRDVLRERISNKDTDYLLLACCFLSGLSDTGCFSTWSCFVNMQTSPMIRLVE